ncbi:MAG: septum formation inhibitor Maf [Ignavibacteriae bacterium]|nr:septum formation inhibitor Maf [Ignavibacteriota bacterium]
MVLNKRLILASRSPRRQHLLRQLGLEFEVRESGVDEQYDSTLSPADYVRTLSAQKALALGKLVDDAIIIGADTIVVLNGKILGKPKDHDDAARMLHALSGQVHEVYTGFTLLDRPSDQRVSEVEITKVQFRTLSSKEIEQYITSGSPMDKAGAYGIQDDYGVVFVEKIDGCFYNVVGFPLAKFYVTIQEFQKRLKL